MLDKIHVATVAQDGYTRILVYLDGSIEVVQFGNSIAINTEVVDRLIEVRDRETMKRVNVDAATVTGRQREDFSND